MWGRRYVRQEINFHSMFPLEGQSPSWDVLFSEHGALTPIDNRVLSAARIIPPRKPSRTLPFWLHLNRPIYRDGTEMRVAEIRGSWVLVSLDEESAILSSSPYPSFIGIYQAKKLEEFFDLGLTRLERATL